MHVDGHDEQPFLSACGFNFEPWTNQSGNETAGTGDPKSIGTGWGTGSARNCDQLRHLYCFER